MPMLLNLCFFARRDDSTPAWGRRSVFVVCLSAGLLTWFLYSRTVAPQRDRKVQVVVASRDLPLGTLLRKQDLKMAPHLEGEVPKGVVFQLKDAEDRVLLVPMNSNEPVLLAKLSATTTVEGISST